MSWNIFNKPLFASSRLSNEAIAHWRQRQQYLLENNKEAAKQECLEVIRLCQLSITADQREGDAYVLLANALLSSVAYAPRHTNPESYEFLISGAAAIIHLWHSFTYRGYPITVREDTGEKILRAVLDEIMQNRSLPEQNVIAWMDYWRDNLAGSLLSPTSFHTIQAKLASSAQKLAHEEPKGWTPDKTIAYESPAVIDSEMINSVSKVNKERHENQRRIARLLYVLPLSALTFAIMTAIPGALIGWITGFWKLHIIAAILVGLFFFITYPRSRPRWGFRPDWFTYFNAICGAIGGALACYFAGQLLH